VTTTRFLAPDVELSRKQLIRARSKNSGTITMPKSSPSEIMAVSMYAAITSAKRSHAAVERLLSDAVGYSSDLGKAVRTMEDQAADLSTDYVSQAIARYLAVTTPAAIRDAICDAKGTALGKFLTPTVIRRSAAADLCEVLEAEVVGAD
jgi:hypothetical protein